MSDASVSTITNAEGLGIPRHGKESTFCLICLKMSVCATDQGLGFFLTLLYRGLVK